MKSIDKVIKSRKLKIEKNNLEIIEYTSHSEIKCKCRTCDYVVIDNHRNLCYKNYNCKYCNLLSISNVLKNGDSEIIKIDSKKIELKCKNGHIYTQTRGNLLKGKKCIKCYLLNKTYTINEILEEFEKVHGNYYNYDLSDYKNLHSKIKIECNKNHIFSQKVSNHLQGKACPKCRESLGERVISKFLEDREIKYIRQKKFNDCKYISYLPFDFFVEEYNLLIEYDGIQHEKPVKLFGGEKEFKKTQIKDDIKNKYCLDKKINLLRISHRDDIFEKLNTIKEYIIFKS